MAKALSEDAVPAALVELVADIYQAAHEPHGWQPLLERIAGLFKADAGVLFTPAEGLLERFLCVNHGLPDDWMHLYGEHFWQHDIWTVRAQEKSYLFQGAMASGHELVNAREMKRSEFYNDFLVPSGVEETLSSVLFDDRTNALVPRTHLSILRKPGRKDFAEQDKKLLKLLMPHLQRALVLYWRTAYDRLRLLANESAIDKLGHGVALLGQDGGVVFSSPNAERIFAASDGLSVRGGRISVRQYDSGALGGLVTNALNGVGGSLMVERPSGETPYTLIASPLDEANHFAHLAGLPAVALLILDPAQCQPKDSLATFARAYQLTPAEIRVMQLLLQDQSPKQIAGQLNLSIHTVRSQLSSIYAKTDTQNQRELIARFMRASRP
jgi:DNA-binding CsgD family transcriptional regulator